MLLFFLSFFGAGVGGRGELAKVIFLTKNPNLKKKKKKRFFFFSSSFFFVLEGGGGEGG